MLSFIVTMNRANSVRPKRNIAKPLNVNTYNCIFFLSTSLYVFLSIYLTVYISISLPQTHIRTCSRRHINGHLNTTHSAYIGNDVFPVKYCVSCSFPLISNYYYAVYHTINCGQSIDQRDSIFKPNFSISVCMSLFKIYSA